MKRIPKPIVKISVPLWSKDLLIVNEAAKDFGAKEAERQGRILAAFFYCHTSGIFLGALEEELKTIEMSDTAGQGYAAHVKRIKNSIKGCCNNCVCCKEKC